MADYRKAFQDAIMNQQAADPMQKQLESRLMQADGASLAPTMGLIDSLTGSRLSQAEPQRVDQAAKLQQLLGMKQQQQAQKLAGLGKLASMQDAAEARAEERDYKKQMYGLQMMAARAKAAKAGAEGTARKLGGEDIKAINNIDSMLADIPKLKAALQRGEGLRPRMMGITIGGDNEATAARARIKEFFGRNQSGGAIGDVESQEFLNIISGIEDSDEMRYQKLDNLEKDVLRRRNAFYYGPGAQPGSTAGMVPAPRGPAMATSSPYADMDDDELAALYASGGY